MGALFGVLIGLPAVKLRRDYVAIVSLGFGQALVAFLQNASSVTGGALGLTAIPRYIEQWHICLALVVVIVAIASLKKSRFGRQCIAIKHDELAAASMGIHVSRVKLVVFTLAAAISALGGYLYVHTLGYMTPALRLGPVVDVDHHGVLRASTLDRAVFAGILLTCSRVFRFSNELRVILSA